MIVSPDDLSRGEAARLWPHPATPGIDLLKARYITHSFARHTHDAYCIATTRTGVETFVRRGTRFYAPAGTIVLVNPDEVHDGRAAEPAGWSYVSFYPRPEVVSDIAADLGLRRVVPYFSDGVVDDPPIARLLTSAHVAAEAADALASTSLLRQAFVLLVDRHASRIVRRSAMPGAAGLATVDRAREILHARLAESPSLGELAAAVGVGQFALVRAFRKITGMPPHAYLVHERVRAAIRLLDAGLPPATVAAEVGFTDQAHLSRHFRRHLGVPPGAYQRERLHSPDGLGRRRVS